MVPGLIGCSTRENEPPVSSPDSLNPTPSPGPSQTDFPSSCRTEKCSLRACILFPFAPFTSLLVKTIVHVEKIVTSHIGLHEKPCVSRSPMPPRTLIETKEVSYIQGMESKCCFRPLGHWKPKSRASGFWSLAESE